MYAVIPAAGSSSRMGGVTDRSKVFYPLHGKSVLALTVQGIVRSEVCRGIVILTRAGDETEAERILREEAPHLDNSVQAGGITRQESVAVGLELLSEKAQFVLVHDGARPLCPPEKIREVAEAARSGGAAILGLPVKPSLKELAEPNVIVRTVPRENVWEAQTPQVFAYELLARAHDAARREGFLGTDESELVERLGVPVRIVSGDERNIKITTPLDLALAASFLERR